MTRINAGEGAGRYAPSPSGDLHLGNLRTAVLAWLHARSSGREFHLRIDDIDAERSSTAAADRQLADLAALGITHDGPITRQQDHLPHYADALAQLRRAGRVYECYCSRKDIAEASRAAHGSPDYYPGTCRELSAAQRRAKQQELAARGRVGALRLASDIKEYSVRNHANGTAHTYTGPVDDFVLRRGGNANQVTGNEYAYNLTVIIDDAITGVDQVVRGDDLLPSTPRQAYLAQLLELPPVEYVHVPLVLGPGGRRLAKRDGAVTMRELGVQRTWEWIVDSLYPENTPSIRTIDDLLEHYDLRCLPPHPVQWET